MTALRTVGVVLSLLGLLVAGFVIYLFALSSVQHQRVQTNLFKTFRGQLGEAVAPAGPARLGVPVALLDVPRLGLQREVVVEGTGAAQLTSGPGHLVSTPLPGQAGVSTIFGRRTTFGAPFARLSQLRTGDTITVTSGAGTARYVVNAFGRGDAPIADPAPNRLVLVTGDSALVTDHTVLVGARLEGDPLPAPVRPAAGTEQRALKADPSALLPLMLWCAALVAVAVAATVGAHLWARGPAYLVLAPVLLAVLWNVYENAAQLLPNVY